MDTFVGTFISVVAAAALAGCAHTPEVHYPAPDVPSGGQDKDDPNFAQGLIHFKLAATAITVTMPDDTTPSPSPDTQLMKLGAGKGGGGGTPSKDDAAPATGTAISADALLQSLRGKRKDVSNLAGLIPEKVQVSAVKIPGKEEHTVVADDPWWYRSNLSPQYFPATKLMSTFGAEAEDNSVTAIQSAGGVLAGIATVLAFVTKTPAPKETPPHRVPFVIDLSAALNIGTGECVVMAGKEPPVPKRCQVDKTGWWYRIVARPVTGTVETQAFFKRATVSGSSYKKLFPVSTCRDITLYISDAEHGKDSDPFDLTISDPGRVIGIPIPGKGSIAMPDVCGANVTVNASGSPSNLDVLNALAQAAVGVHKAQQGDSK